VLLALLEEALEADRDVAHERCDVAVAELDGGASVVDARRLEEGVDLLEQCIGVGPDALDVAVLLGVARRGSQQAPRQPEDDRQRRLQLVPGVGHELATARPGVAPKPRGVRHLVRVG
jgi:hypothetical protein